MWGAPDDRLALLNIVKGIETAPPGSLEVHGKGSPPRVSDDRTRLAVSVYLFDIDLHSTEGLRVTDELDELQVLDDLVEGYFRSSLLPGICNGDRRTLFRMSATFSYNSLFVFNDWARKKLTFERFCVIAHGRCIGDESTCPTDEESKVL